MPPGKRTNSSPMLSLLLTYLLFLLLVFLVQRKIIYFPETFPQQRLAELASQLGLQAWPTAENYRGFISQDTKVGSKGSIVVFHGNAGSAIRRSYYIDALERLGYRVILAEYPGYGARPGPISEKILIDDGIRTTKMVLQEFSGPLFLWGESLGSGVVAGIIASGQVPVAGIALITPFDSLANVAQHHYWYLLAKWLVKDKFNNIEYLGDYQGYSAMIIAHEDDIIPNARSLKLYDALSGQKKLWEFEQSGHNDLPMHPKQAWWHEVMAFIDPRDQ